MHFLFFVVFIMLVTFIFVVYMIWRCVLLVNKTYEYPTCYGIMITGKDETRLKYAQISTLNFFDQDYKGKKQLIIINHSEERVNIPSMYEHLVIQIQVDKATHSLGAMRNVALDLVPNDALWTSWDDDDYRSKWYLSTLYNFMKSEKVSAVTFTDRYEYNISNGMVWRFRMESGFGYACMLCKKKKGFKYHDVDTFEDRDLKKFYASSIYVYENVDKVMYIRLVHANNTSMFVHRTNSYLDLNETNGEYLVSDKEKELVKNIMVAFEKS